MADRHIRCDILIVGGGAGGTAAALAAATLNLRVCLIEETDWLGGQLTSQGVCTPDEQSHIETFGATRTYAEFRQRVRDYYRSHYRLAPHAAGNPHFNPGNCWVSRLSFEPAIGAQILRDMLRPYTEAGLARLYFRTRAVACEMDRKTGATVTAVVAETETGERLRFRPHYVLDATDLGDLLPMCGHEGADWVVGAESRAETGEPDAPDQPRPDWVQPFTFPFALEWSPETAATNVIEPPEDYDRLKAQQDYKIMHGAITGLFEGRAPWWSYRRILAAENFNDPRIPRDVAMINTAGNDYYGGNIIGTNAGDADEVAATLARARRASLGYVYWLQTECPREEAKPKPRSDSASWGTENPQSEPRTRVDSELPPPKTGYPEFKLRTDLFPTDDGCSIKPYIREARRIRSLRPILEQEIVVNDFKGGVCRGNRARAAAMPDTVGIGHYWLDIHPNGHGEPNAFVATRPFQIPLGALIPVRWANLLPACKNLGVTHLTNGAYRLHPIEWNIGESAALLAANCLMSGLSPAQVYANASARLSLQRDLIGYGVPLHWFVDVPLDHPAFAGLQELATLGLDLGREDDLLFRPEEPITQQEWQRWSAAAGKTPGEFTGTRSEAIVALMNDAD